MHMCIYIYMYYCIHHLYSYIYIIFMCVYIYIIFIYIIYIYVHDIRPLPSVLWMICPPAFFGYLDMFDVMDLSPKLRIRPIYRL